MSDFVANPAFEAELLASPQMHAFLERRAKDGEQFARSIAPIYAGSEAGRPAGTFEESIHGKVAQTAHGPAARVESTDPKFEYIEFGTSDTPAHGTLRRTLDHMKGR